MLTWARQLTLSRLLGSIMEEEILLYSKLNPTIVLQCTTNLYRCTVFLSPTTS